MTDNATPIATLLQRAEDYGNTSIELFKLNAIDKSADVASSLVSRLAVVITVALSFLIINIGVALWLGKILGDSYHGFFIIGGSYGLLAVLFYIFRHRWLKYPISNLIIRQLLKQKIV